MAPFAVVAPLIGPAIDRREGGRRLMVVLSAVIRAVLCVFMIDDLDSLLLFPEVFAVLVLAKGYSVAKSALVPTTVATDAELVEANSKLTLISGIVGFVAALPGLALLQLGPGWVLGLAAAVFSAATVFGLRLPRTAVAAEPTDAAERAELRSGGILLGATAMGLLRLVVGFLTFLVAFGLRNDGAPAWWFGAVIAASGAGSLVGAAVAPVARRRFPEERIIISSLAGVTALAVVAAWMGGRLSAAVLAGGVAAAASAGKLAFDALVQRDAPDANRGRSFARFETRFQLVWVLGAFLPVVIPIPLVIGYLLLGGAAAFVGVFYFTGLAHLRRNPHLPPPSLPGTQAAAHLAGRVQAWPPVDRVRRWRRGSTRRPG